MKIATTTGDFGFYCHTDAERIRELHRAGFRYIDFNMYSFKPDSVYMQNGWKDAVQKLSVTALNENIIQITVPSLDPYEVGTVFLSEM